MALKQKHLIFFSISSIVLLLDIITKAIITAKLTFGQSIPLIKNILHLTLVKNYGVSFGLLSQANFRWLWMALVIIAVIIIFYYYKDLKNWLTIIAASLILAGALGNGIDRLIKGFVIDFIDFRIWPAFNIADSAITIGAILLIIYWWKTK